MAPAAVAVKGDYLPNWAGRPAMMLTPAARMRAEFAEAEAVRRQCAADERSRRAELDRHAALFSAALAAGNRSLTRRALRLIWELS
jgi:hypothetical protein